VLKKSKYQTNQYFRWDTLRLKSSFLFNVTNKVDSELSLRGGWRNILKCE